MEEVAVLKRPKSMKQLAKELGDKSYPELVGLDVRRENRRLRKAGD